MRNEVESIQETLAYVKKTIPITNSRFGQKGIGKYLSYVSEEGHINNLKGAFCFSTIISNDDGSYDYILMQDDTCTHYRQKSSTAKEERLLELHRHNYYEISYIAGGEGYQSIEGTEVKTVEGEFAFMDCNTCHMEEARENAVSAICYLCLSKNWFFQIAKDVLGKNVKFDEFYRSFVCAEQNDRKGYLLFSDRGYREKAESLLSLIMYEMLYHEPGYENVVKGYLIRLFHLIMESQASESTLVVCKVRKDVRAAEEIIRYLKENKRRIPRAELSDIFHYQEDYISRIIKKYTGLPLKAYMNSLLIEEAERMLLTTELSVNQIMKHLGFDNETYFYKIFHQKHQMTPLEYRKKVGK